MLDSDLPENVICTTRRQGEPSSQISWRNSSNKRPMVKIQDGGLQIVQFSESENTDKFL